jgi:hypothetical protein
MAKRADKIRESSASAGASVPSTPFPPSVVWVVRPLRFGEDMSATRYYNPAIGLFTQEDPSGQTAGYLYVGDSPVNGVDPNGQESVYVGCAKAALLTADIALAAVLLGAPEFAVGDILFSCLVGAAGALLGGSLGSLLDGSDTISGLYRAFTSIFS